MNKKCKTLLEKLEGEGKLKIWKEFKFPEPFDNGLRLKDFLESNVDEKYYISKDKTEKLIESLKEKQFSNAIRSGGRGSLDRHQWDAVCINTKMQDDQIREDGMCCTLTSSMYKEPPQIPVQINRGNLQVKEDEICSCLDANYFKGLDNHAARMPVLAAIKVGNVNPSGNGMNGCVYSEDGLCPTVTTNKGEGSKILTNNSIIDTRQHIDGVRLYNDICPTITGTDYKEPKKVVEANECNCLGRLENVNGHDYLKRVYSAEGCSPTIPTCCGGGHEPKILEPHELIQVGEIEGQGFESRRRVYSPDGLSPTLHGIGSGGGTEPKILEDFYANRDVREYDECPTLRADRQGLKVLEGIQYSRKGTPKLTDMCNTLTAQDPSRTLGNYNPIVGVLENTNQIIKVDVPQLVSVRKHEVNIPELQELLRSHKKSSKLSNKDIAEKLEIPTTLVEHWFRTDKCFSIPDADIWLKLKELLNISTGEFDESVMEFEERWGTYEKSERCYHEDGIAPCLTSTSADEKIITNIETPKPELVGGIGEINFGKQYRQGNRVYDAEKTAMCLLAQPVGNAGGNSYLYAVDETDKANGCSLRTRNYMNQPQQLEVRDDELSNSITTVTKDAMAFEEPQYRIRKLTPMECWKLMGFAESDFEKAKYFTKQESEEILKNFPKHKGKRIFNHEERIERMSDSQLYKMAGNSIVVNVLEYIFKNLFIK